MVTRPTNAPNGELSGTRYRLPLPIEGVDFTAPDVDPPVIGSVQELTPATYDGRECFVSRTTDGGSVFDVGSFFEVPQSGELRTAVRHDIFRALGDPQSWRDLSAGDLRDCFDSSVANYLLNSDVFRRFRERGARTHHMGLVDVSQYPARIVAGERGGHMSDMVLIERFGVVRPTPNGDGTYNYDAYFDALQRDKPIVFGVENIFRLGNAGGSSLQKRYDALLHAELDSGDRAERIRELLEPYGLAELYPWMRFPSATPDSTTKYEAYDRQLTIEGADALFGGSFVANHARDILALCTAHANKYFKNMGLQLWDLKWEIASDGTQLVVVDTLDPDGVRVTSLTELEPGVFIRTHFNKQAVRDHFHILHPQWVAALDDAKRRSDSDGRNWHDIYDQGVRDGIYPPIPELDPRFADIQARKYAYIAQGEDDLQERQRIASAEAAYYRLQGDGAYGAFMARNQTSQSG